MIDPTLLVGGISTLLNTFSGVHDYYQSKELNRNYTQGGKQIYSKGGKIRGHNNYNAPLHSQGGQTVNEKGIPTPNTNHEIHSKESKYTYSRIKDDTYVFTPQDTKKINKLTKKYDKANKSTLQKNALELEIQRVENDNEMKKQYKKGGKIKYNTGGPINPLYGLQGLSKALRMAYSQNKSVNEIPTLNPLQVARDDKARPAISPLPKINYAAQPTMSSQNPIDDQIASKAGSVYSPATSSNQSDPAKTLDLLRNITLGSNALGLLSKAEEETPIMTDYTRTNQELNNLRSDLTPLKAQAQKQSNLASKLNRSQASSFNQYSNRELQNFSNLRQSLNSVSLQERNLANGIAGQRAQVAATQALDNKQTLQQDRVNNQMNEANNRNINRQIKSDLLAEVDRKSTILNQARITEVSREEGMQLLSSMFENFQPGDYDIMYKVAQSGYESLSPEEKKRYDNKQLIKANIQ